MRIHYTIVRIFVLYIPLFDLPSCVFALWGGTQHWNIWHNDNIILGSIWKLFTKYKRFTLIEANCTIIIMLDVYFFPRLAIEKKRNNKDMN